MSDPLVYLYGIVDELPEEALPSGLEGVDGKPLSPVIIEESSLRAVSVGVDAEDFSEEALEARAGDPEWLADVAIRHQAVIGWIHQRTTVVPARILTVFESRDAVREWLARESGQLVVLLGELRDREEWTLGIHFDSGLWTRWIDSSVESKDEQTSGSPGKNFLLRKKQDLRRAESGEMVENEMLSEVASDLEETYRVMTEDRLSRGGADPQFNILIERDTIDRLEAIVGKLEERWNPRGVSFDLIGPWPPYSFTQGAQGDD